MKYIFLFTVIGFLMASSCKTNKAASTALTNNTAKQLQFNRLVYHTSFCFGSCPKIDMLIDSAGNISLRRETISVKSMGKPGLNMYKGQLTNTQYDSVINLLAQVNYKSLVWDDVTCCDGVITTLIVYAGSDKKYLKSMLPSQESQPLLNYLHTLGLKTDLPKTGDEIELEQ